MTTLALYRLRHEKNYATCKHERKRDWSFDRNLICGGPQEMVPYFYCYKCETHWLDGDEFMV